MQQQVTGAEMDEAPVSYRVIAEHQILLVRYSGHHMTKHTDALLKAYRQDPAVVRGLRVLLDFAHIRSAELDIAKRRDQMAKLAHLLRVPGARWSVSYYCPSEVSLSLTEMQRKMWESDPEVDFHVAHNAEEVAAALALPLAVARSQLQRDDEDAATETEKGPSIWTTLSRFSF